MLFGFSTKEFFRYPFYGWLQHSSLQPFNFFVTNILKISTLHNNIGEVKDKRIAEH